jgi:hypothetical protein
MERSKRLLSFFLLFITSVSGCAGYHSKCYDGPELEKSKISIITTDDQFVTIGGVDGEKIKFSKASNFFNGLMWDGRFPRTVSVLPGHHSILPCYQNPYEASCANSWFDIDTKADQTYIIKHKRQDNKMYEFSIEPQQESDRTTHQKLLNL